MKCPECQHENPDGARFCNRCGRKLEFVCPSCKNVNPAFSNFCNACGYDLRKPTGTSLFDYNQPQSYTPKFLVDKILTTRSAMEGERKIVTVLFADVADYTSISEKLDPEETHQIMDGCFKILMDEVHKHEGTINQFTGDGVMALFGAPVAHEDHAHRACHAALSIQKALTEYGERLARDFGIDFRMRMGLNSGPVMVGAIGDDLRMDYTAVGDTTNLASRMESLAQPGTTLLSKNTYSLVKDNFESRPLGKTEVKGKEETQEIYVLVKASDVETRIGASRARGLSRFVGRRNSMDALIDAFRKVQSGLGQIVGIVGEAGVGKSRILLELRNQLPNDDYMYLEGRCLHFGVSMAYLPILDVLRSYFDIEEGDGESAIKEKMEEKLLELNDHLSGLPPLGELLSISVDREYLRLDPQQKRRKAFEAIRDLLLRLSLNKVLVVAIEDLQWIDRTSEDFLDYLITWIGNRKILLILLYRPEYTHQWSSKSYYNHIGLDQLTAESSEELLNALFKEERVDPKLKDLVLDRTAGNPLFIEEFTRSLLESGSIEKRNNRFVLATEFSDIRIPESVQGIIASRIDRFGENLKIVTQMASVIGREFSFGILQTITGFGEELKSYLLDLQKLEFIYEKRLYPELEYIFKHALTQEVAYETLLLRRRKAIHKKIGQAMEQIYVDKLEELYPMLAYHYDKAEIPDKAIHYLSRAADRAKSIYANEEAIIFYRNAIAQVSRHRRGKEIIQEEWGETATELHESLADVLALMGRHQEARKGYENALAACTRKRDPIRRARLHRKSGNVRREERCYEEALQAYNQAETALRLEPKEIDPRVWQAWIEIQNDRMWLLYWQAQLEQMSELAERTRPAVERYGTPDLQSKFFQSLSLMGMRRERYMLSEETLSYAQASLEAIQGSGNLSEISLAQFSLGFSCLWCEDLDAADEHLKATLKLAESIGDIVVQSRCLTYLTVLHRKRGLVEEVKRYITRALDVATTGNMLEYISAAKANTSWVNLSEGNLSEAWENGRAALEIWQKAPLVYPFQWTALWPLLYVALAKEEMPMAVQYAVSLLEPNQQRLPDSLSTVLEKGIKEWQTGESEASRFHLNRAIGLAQKLGLF